MKNLKNFNNQLGELKMLVKPKAKYYQEDNDEEKSRKQKIEEFLGYSIGVIAYAAPFLILLLL